MTSSTRENEDQAINLQEEIKEPICSNEGEDKDAVLLEEVPEETDPLEQEIESLKNQVFDLQQSKQELERQLLLYNGLKEQDSVKLNELQRVVDAKTAQIEVLGKKIESLEGENRRLEGLAAERAMLKAEMESARMKMKETRSKIRKSWGKKKEVMTKLLQQMAAQRAREAEMHSMEAEMKMIIEGLHGEIEELKRTNVELLSDKNELMKKLDSIVEAIATEREATEKANEEANRLKIANAKLSKQIEMYRNDRRTDIEELIYLRWINACLKYELQKRHNSKDQKSPSMKHEKGEKIVVELGLDEKCTGYDSDCSSTDTFESIVIDAETERGPKKSRPKLLHRIKGWVKNNDERTNKVQDENQSSNLADEKVKVRSSRPRNLLFYCGELDCASEMKISKGSQYLL
ncbi:CHUP1 protein [Nymphaea thermarum]|nr:CHUP1 protein [Nymphaea thermarum]